MVSEKPGNVNHKRICNTLQIHQKNTQKNTKKKDLHGKMCKLEFIAQLGYATRSDYKLVAPRPCAARNAIPYYFRLSSEPCRGAGLRGRPLPQAEAPTEPAGETTALPVFDLYEKRPRRGAALPDITESPLQRARQTEIYSPFHRNP